MNIIKVNLLPGTRPHPDLAPTRGALMVGESIEFVSTSYDEDDGVGEAGRGILHYDWFVNGIRVQSGPASVLTHTLRGRGPLRVDLEVTDNEGMTSRVARMYEVAGGLEDADFDGDGDIDAEDLNYWSSCIGGPLVDPDNGCDNRDLDGDWDVDLLDFLVLQAAAYGPNEEHLYGDITSDGILDEHDYQLWMACITGPDGLAGPVCGRIDTDGDSDIDMLDLCVLQRQRLP